MACVVVIGVGEDGDAEPRDLIRGANFALLDRVAEIVPGAKLGRVVDAAKARREGRRAVGASRVHRNGGV